MTLSTEIEKKSKEIRTDGYPMSIGELMNLYKDGDLVIFPEYQRYFRWNINQKSDLIESILLGIPVPPIFVSQDKNGKWDVVDGLQRISTIFEFAGILKDKDGNDYSPSEMVGTKFLPSLEEKVWQSDDDNSLSESERRLIKRRKLNIIIIDSINDPMAKYELFQRLNTNGAELKDQEIRNCLILMVNKDFYNDIKNMSQYDNFKDSISISERLISEQYDKELIVRYLVARNNNLSNVSSNEDIGKLLTDKILELINNQEIDFEEELDCLKKTFDLLKETLGEDSFKKFNTEKGKFEGAFLLSAFEVIILGLSENLDYWNQHKEGIVDKVKSIYSHPAYESATCRGKRPILRFKELSDLSREMFKHEG